MMLIVPSDTVAFTEEALERCPWLKYMTKTKHGNRFKVLAIGRSLSGEALNTLEIKIPKEFRGNPALRNWFCGSLFELIVAVPLYERKVA